MKAIGEYGDKNVSQKVINNQELTEIMDRIYENMTSLKKDNMFELEEAINEYTAKTITIAYLTGFKDCMELKDNLDKMK